MRKLFTRRFCLVWLALGILLVLVLSLTIPPLRTIANDFLSLFRTQPEKAPQLDLSAVSDINSFGNAGLTITQLLSERLEVTKQGEIRQGISPAEASALAGIPIRLPALAEGEPEISTQPGYHVEFVVNLPRLRFLLGEAGLENVSLPDALDGAVITADIPVSVKALYGGQPEVPVGSSSPTKSPSDVCWSGEGSDDPDDSIRGQRWGPECIALAQFARPTIETPAGVDLTPISKAFLRFAGVPADGVEALSQVLDWSVMLVIPIPNYTTYRTVTVDGVPGVLALQYATIDVSPFLLIWEKDGVVYSLEGYGNMAIAQAIANSLK